ncbi:MAG: sensor domain-containing diguanylate cyclase [Acidobacteriota bacterium]
MTIDIQVLEPRMMGAFLERRRATFGFSSEMSLADNLAEILRKANEFVPSEAGSILLDNPLDKRGDRHRNDLTFVASFGERASQLVGRRISGSRGIAGHVYVDGEPYHASNAHDDEFFFAGMDQSIDYETRSVVAVPIRIEQDVCGVLELLNRVGAPEYSDGDRNLLRIFAGYISVSIQNILDGRRAQELAKRDNLTGLFNDHYLHVALTQSIERALAEDVDLAVIFLDLDHFKTVNDTHGHLAGSQVLREIGHLLKGALRPYDDGTAARYGGDEFVLVVPGVGLDEAVDLAENIRTEIVHTTFCNKPGDIQREALDLSGITCSIGIATVRRHVAAVDSVEEFKSTLLRVADSAMYVAKRTGRNRCAVASEPVTPRRFQSHG